MSQYIKSVVEELRVYSTEQRLLDLSVQTSVCMCFVGRYFSTPSLFKGYVNVLCHNKHKFGM